MLSVKYFLMDVNKIEAPFSIELDYGASSTISRSLTIDIGSTNKGLGNITSSNSFILFFNIKFFFLLFTNRIL
jgi:hypothetical protein